MMASWFSNLLGQGSGNSKPFWQRAVSNVVTRQPTGRAAFTQYNKSPFQQRPFQNQRSNNAWAGRLQAQADAYMRRNQGTGARGVAQVRAVDRAQPMTSNQWFANYRQNNPRQAQMNPMNTVANVRLYDQYVDYQNYLRGLKAWGGRYTAQAEDYFARQAANNQQPTMPGYGNQYGYGYGDGYGGYGDYGGGSSAALPDWYSNFLSMVNWRI